MQELLQGKDKQSNVFLMTTKMTIVRKAWHLQRMFGRYDLPTHMSCLGQNMLDQKYWQNKHQYHKVAPPLYFLSSDPKGKSYGNLKIVLLFFICANSPTSLKSLQATLSEMSHDSFASNFQLSSQDSSSNSQRDTPQTIRSSSTTRCWWILREATNKLAQAQCFCKHVLALQNRKAPPMTHMTHCILMVLADWLVDTWKFCGPHHI